MSTNNKRSIFIVLIILLFGCIIGTALSQLFSLILPDSVVKQFFLKTTSIGWGNSSGWVDFNIIRFKRKVQKANGDKNTQPTLVDAGKKPLDKIVGNGSKVKVMYRPYDWNFKGKKGKGLDLQAVQVVDLIEYTPKEDFQIEQEV